MDKTSSAGQGGGAREPRPRLFLALVAIALATPLPFGAVAGWAQAVVAGSFGVLLLAWGVLTLARRMPVAAPPPFLLWSALGFATALLWGVVQTVGFTPESWHHPLWRGTAEALNTPYHGAVSLDPVAGRESIVRLVTYACVFWLAFQYCRDARCAWYVLRAVAIGSACYALYGLAVVFSGAEVILWFPKTEFLDAVTATFVNPNSFATYAGIGLLCTAAVLSDRSGDAAGPFGIRERLRFLIDEFVPRNAVVLACGMVLASALLLSLSRGGAAAAALGLVAFVGLRAAGRGVGWGSLTRRFVGPVLAGAALLILVGEGLERRLWDIGADWEKRWQIYSLTVKAVDDAPLVGTGLGTYASVYRSHRTEEIRRGVRKAHNDYLELALELGVPAAVLLVFAMAKLGLGCAGGVRARHRDAALPAVGAASCTLVGAHALVDFSLQIPAVAVTFALVLGVGVAQARPTGSGAVISTRPSPSNAD